MDESKLKVTLETDSQQRMVVEATTVGINKTYEIGENLISDV